MPVLLARSFANRIESDHAALKRLLTPMRGFKTLRCAKATLQGIEAFRTLKRRALHQPPASLGDEISYLCRLFGVAESELRQFARNTRPTASFLPTI